MKVLHININYITTVLHQTMIEKLEDLGVKNSVFAPTYNRKLAVITPNSNVVVSECFNKWDRISYFYKQKKILASIQKEFTVNDYDILHAYTLFSDGNVAYELKKKYGIPYVVAVRDTDVNDFMKYKPYLINRGIEIMENADKVFFLSPAYKEKALHFIKNKNKLKQIEGKAEIVPNGINDFWLENLNIANNVEDKVNRIKRKELRIICVAQIIRRKNIPTLQKAVEVLINEGWNVELTLIGKPVDIKLLTKIKQCQHTKYVSAMPKEKLVDYLRQADIFALVSNTETFGLVYAEALSQGLPVIYSKREGFDGQFDEGIVGYAVDNHEVHEIADGIRRIAKDYTRISKNCLDSVNKFNWSIICDKYIRLYSEILND